ncbi:MAG: hypothetical protein JNG89_00280, partial [Planctomycetaceae bacterium]|nr:hypothetical protein [Planctomycetaceae bacterium]
PLLHIPRLPVLPAGRLPDDDPVGRQLAAAIFDSLLPEPLIHGEVCAITLPLVLPEPVTKTKEWQFFSRLARLRGFRPIPADACTAAALSGLGHARFTGLALVIDATASGLALFHHGAEVLRTTIPLGGDWIDEHLARKTERLVWDMDGACYVDVEAILRWKRERAPNLHAPQSDEVQMLAYIYEQLLADLLKAFATECEKTAGLDTLRGPFSISCCGAATMPAGFPQLLANRIERARLPFDVDELRSPDDGEYAVARGALILAEIESIPGAIPAAA